MQVEQSGLLWEIFVCALHKEPLIVLCELFVLEGGCAQLGLLMEFGSYVVCEQQKGVSDTVLVGGELSQMLRKEFPLQQQLLELLKRAEGEVLTLIEYLVQRHDTW